MRRIILLFTLCALLMGQDDCEGAPPAPEPGEDPYCYGEPTVMRQVEEAGSQLWTILGGEPSTDRRVTLRVVLDGGHCSGGAIDQYTYLTAGHCTWGSDKTTAALGGYSTPPYWDKLIATEHPEYKRYKQSGNQYAAGRYYDVSVVKVGESRDGEADGLPGPYAGIFHLESEEDRSRCVRMWIQGWGKHEEPGLELREGQYVIDAVTPTSIRSFIDPDEASICFGDSGSLLVAEMEDGSYKAVGVTSTTDDTSCRRGSTHARLDIMEPWIEAQR